MVIVVHTDIAVSLEKSKHPIGSRRQSPGAPWQTVWNQRYTPVTLMLSKPLFCRWGNWDLPRLPSWLVVIQESERKSESRVYSAGSDPSPPLFLTHWLYISSLLPLPMTTTLYIPPLTPTQTHSTRAGMYTRMLIPLVQTISHHLMPSLSSAFPETALASVLSPKFYLLTTCSYTNLSLFKTSVCLLTGMLWHLVSCCSLIVLSVWLVFPVILKAAQEQGLCAILRWTCSSNSGSYLKSAKSSNAVIW